MKAKKYDYKKYYHRKRKEGWVGLSIFGPRAMIEAAKEWLRVWKQNNDFYER